MRVPFSRTMALLQADRPRGYLRIGAALTVLIAAWATWLTTASTTVYAVSEEGRLLAAGAASPIQVPVSGVIENTSLALGAEVKAGDVLVVLDTSAERLRRDEETTRADGLRAALDSLDLILEAERGLASANLRAGASRISSAATKAQVASDIAALTKQQDEAMRRLRESSLASGLEVLKSAEDLQRQRGAVSVNRAETALAAADLERSRREVEVRLLGLKRELVDLRARIAASQAVVAQLDWEISRRTLRAPVAGTVADVAALPKGAAVSPMQMLATIVPHAEMRWVAYFPPREAVGRVKAGQAARVRVDAFPWTAYGALSARVVSVGSEPREQRIRVELVLVADPKGGSIPLSHGMTGTVDVEVESLSPMRLLLRLAGQTSQTAPRPAPQGAADPALATPGASGTPGAP